MQLHIDPKTLPRYKCHKEIGALQIKHITASERGGYLLEFHEEGHDPIAVDSQWMKHFNPVPGAYLVVYDNGFVSVSPAKALKDGYTAMTDLATRRYLLMREAEKAAQEYAASLDVGPEREKAFEIYENLRNAGRVY